VGHVQQQLCSLLEPTIVVTMRCAQQSSKGSVSDRAAAASKPWEWLLNTAGPAAVAAPAVAEALLHISPSIHPSLEHVVTAVAFDKGLKLPVQLLVAAAKEQSKEVEKWLRVASQRADAEGICFSSSISRRMPKLVQQLHELRGQVGALISSVSLAVVHWQASRAAT
jgi:hypothetical protein